MEEIWYFFSFDTSITLFFTQIRVVLFFLTLLRFFLFLLPNDMCMLASIVTLYFTIALLLLPSSSSLSFSFTLLFLALVVLLSVYAFVVHYVYLGIMQLERVKE